MRRENRQIIDGVIWKQLLIFFFPILLGTAFQQLYNIADAIIVGHTLGTVALAAVGGPTTYLINILLNFFVGVCSGATVVIAQYYGAEDSERTSEAVHTAMLLSIVAGIGFSIVGVALAKTALSWMGTPEEVMPHAVSYLRIYYAGLIFSFIYNMGSSVLRAKGDSKRPFYLLVLATIVNIIGNLVFIIKFHWGVASVAWATTLSQFVSSIGVCYLLAHEKDEFHLSFRRLWPFQVHILRNILHIGVPTGMQSQLFSLSNIIIQTTINSFGVQTIAAWGTFARIDMSLWMTLNSLGVAVSTFAGQNFGARKYDRVTKSIVVAIWYSIITCIVCGFSFVYWGPQLFALFTSDAEVVAIGMKIAWMLAPWYILYFPVTTLAGGMRGTGNSIIPMAVTALGICVFRSLWMWCVVPFYCTMTTVFVSYPVSWALTTILLSLYHWKSHWLEKSIVRAGHRPASE